MKCIICGKEIKESSYSNAILCSSKCFHEHFWNEILSDPETIIIDNTAFHVGDENSKSSFRGYDGQRFIIEKNDGTQVITTNLWCNGNIPEDRHTCDNARFIEEK